MPDVVMWSERDYGNRVGVFRIMETLDRYGIRGTVALNSNLCAEHPAIMAEGEKRKWEWMGHNESNTRRLNEAAPGEEVQIIRNTLGTIAQHTGKRPVGWLSSGLQETWDTLDHLAAEGVRIRRRLVQRRSALRDEAGWRRAPSSRCRTPSSSTTNRRSSGATTPPTNSAQMICDQFDVLYREGAKSGRVMAIALHPYLIGVPHRIGALDAALKYICKHKKVWKATGSEIARHYVAQVEDGVSAKKKSATEISDRRGVMTMLYRGAQALLLGVALSVAACCRLRARRTMSRSAR